MAKTPTLGAWELDLLRTIEHVVRLGHIKHVTRREIVLDDGSVPLAPDSLIVHCAASGLQYPPLVPVWEPDKIRLQTIRVGFPCFCAALAGYVEATRDDDRERNRLCPPNTLPDNPANWARMQVRGTIAARTYGAEPDIAAWANGCALNPARIEPSQRDDPAVQAAAARLADHAEHGLARMAELAHEPSPSVDVRLTERPHPAVPRCSVMASRPASIICPIGVASSSGRTSTVQVKRLRPVPSSTTWAAALWCVASNPLSITE